MGGAQCNNGCAVDALCRPRHGGAYSAVRLEKKYVEKVADEPRGEVQDVPQDVPAQRPRGQALEDYFEADLQELQLARPPPDGWPEEGPRPPVTFQSGATYEGQWRRNLRHGFGRQQWPDGAVYVGQWSESSASGRGMFTFPEGGVYVGEWRRSRFHGLGSYRDPTGTVFRGEWRDGLRSGWGVEDGGGDSSSSTRYAGSFHRGFKDGPGVCSWADGGEYCGQWRTDHITGVGEYNCRERGRRYRGQWCGSMKQGIGAYDWPDGRCYKGQYWQDQASGFGVFAWADGQRYEGHWLFGKQHGAGMYTDANGATDRLSWSNGHPCKVVASI